MAMNPLQLPNHVIYINWDGFAYAWYQLVQERYGGMPNLDALVKEGVLCTQAGTGIPSITGAMQQCIASGAWPEDTGNCHRYYDVPSNKVIQFARQNRLENIAEAALRNGVSLAAVNAWYFENRGTFEGNREQPYIRKELPSNFGQRVDEMIKIILGEPVISGSETLTFREMPRFLSVYADDIDTVAHNGRVTYEGLTVAATLPQWYDNIAQTILRMDKDLGRLLEALKDRGLFERTTIVLTTDHGMVPYGAKNKALKAAPPPEAFSCLPDLIDTIAECGRKFKGERFKVEALCQEGMQAQEDTDIVVTVVTLQAQINVRFPAGHEVFEEIVSQVMRKPYYGTHLHKEELLRRGAMTGFADLVISPQPPFHFSWDGMDVPKAVGANHDSLHKQVHHIITMLSGANIQKGMTYNEQVWMVDIAPTIARLLGFEGPKDAVGAVLDDLLAEELRGPVVAWSTPSAEGERVVSGITVPLAMLRVNGQKAGSSDEKGLFTLKGELLTHSNRWVVEVEASGRITRKIFYFQNVSTVEHQGSQNDANQHPFVWSEIAASADKGVDP
ncbi:alkaline phosphatase family protein [Paenibacillus sp. UNC451MF]|uniref:alkaline phosphatase family protein n=1 Tax=Paenibacillus sp. UNC451MF TaxID=1449063 RepID=UPI00048D453E|nr:alkaline phosphatase family protein [Paenibacillus sp. UNC451MF]